jgi:hypothetical protein
MSNVVVKVIGVHQGQTRWLTQLTSNILENNLGLISLWAWKFYMLWTFITGANFTTTDFVAGLVFFVWAANER